MRKSESARTFRVQVILSSEELSAIDEFRFERRMPTRAAAVRETHEPRPGVQAATQAGITPATINVAQTPMPAGAADAALALSIGRDQAAYF
jgi:hypothetical protein